jgi:hypothetical protein
LIPPFLVIYRYVRIGTAHPTPCTVDPARILFPKIHTPGDTGAHIDTRISAQTGPDASPDAGPDVDPDAGGRA